MQQVDNKEDKQLVNDVIVKSWQGWRTEQGDEEFLAEMISAVSTAEGFLKTV